MKATDYLELGAKTYRERGAIYGDNYLHFGKVFAALFPNGITLKTEQEFLAFVNFMNCQIKLTRIAENLQSGGHLDSALDLSVYAAIMAEVTERVQKWHDPAPPKASQPPQAPKGGHWPPNMGSAVGGVAGGPAVASSGASGPAMTFSNGASGPAMTFSNGAGGHATHDSMSGPASYDATLRHLCLEKEELRATHRPLKVEQDRDSQK